MQDDPAKETSPIRPTDADAIRLGLDLLERTQSCALGVTDPATGAPHVTRIAFLWRHAAPPLSLVSDLALHTRAMRSDPRVSLLIGEPGPKGDPLTHPRITLVAEASFIDKNTAEYSAVQEHYLSKNPKSGLYIGFADFHLLEFQITTAHLNGGFGKAFRLTPGDLGL